jgi:raffinose/stachyose/melibiose transport system permease protein/N-acetylglucosamine transport system permease protein
MEKTKKNKRTFSHWLKKNLLYIFIGLVLFAYAASMIYLLLWAFSVTVKPYSEFIDLPMKIIPKKISFKNWATAFNELKIVGTEQVFYIEDMFLNSLIYSIGCAFTGTLMQCIAAYLTSKYRFRFGKIAYGIVIVTMIMPIVGSLPSELQMMKSLGIYDTYFGMIIMKANFLGANFLVFYAIFKSIPWSYAESAFMDGAGHFRVMIQIMFPLVKTTFFAIFLLNFISYWNDYTGPMLYLPSYPTVAFGMFYMKNVATAAFGREPLQLTGCMMMTVPILVVFLLTQKRLMGNLTMGGLKG